MSFVPNEYQQLSLFDSLGFLLERKQQYIYYPCNFYIQVKEEVVRKANLHSGAKRKRVFTAANTKLIWRQADTGTMGVVVDKGGINDYCA